MEAVKNQTVLFLLAAGLSLAALPSINATAKFDHGFIRSLKVRFQVSNFLNKKVQVLDGIDANPASAFTKDTFNVLPARNYFLTASAEF